MKLPPKPEPGGGGRGRETNWACRKLTPFTSMTYFRGHELKVVRRFMYVHLPTRSETGCWGIFQSKDMARETQIWLTELS